MFHPHPVTGIILKEGQIARTCLKAQVRLKYKNRGDVCFYNTDKQSKGENNDNPEGNHIEQRTRDEVGVTVGGV